MPFLEIQLQKNWIIVIFIQQTFFIAVKAAKKAPLVVSLLLKTAEMLQFEMFVFTHSSFLFSHFLLDDSNSNMQAFSNFI
jgi:hypothetical protein